MSILPTNFQKNRRGEGGLEFSPCGTEKSVVSRVKIWTGYNKSILSSHKLQITSNEADRHLIILRREVKGVKTDWENQLFLLYNPVKSWKVYDKSI